MSDPIVEELGLDLNPALQSLDALNDALTAVATNFGTSLTEALSAAQGTLDVEAISGDLSAAVAAAQDELPPIELDADTSNVEGAIDAISDETATVTVDADTAGAQAAIDGIDEQPITLDVDVDATAAQNELDGLTTSSSEATVGIDGLSHASDGLNVATGFAAGNADALLGIVSKLSPEAKAAAGSAAVLGGFTFALAANAIDAQTATDRLNRALGDQADRINAINIPGFADDLDELAIKTGNSDEALRLAAARIGDLGASAGASQDEIGQTAENIDLLAIRLSVVNPALGDAGGIADRLTNALARGGRALAPFGLALNAADINARALADTGKDTADELTIFEKSAAGAALATEQLGTHLRDDIVAGADQPVIKLRSLRTELDEFLEALGKPLVAPAIDTLERLLPVAEETGAALGNIVRIALPLLEALGPILTPVAGLLGLVADGLGVVADGLELLGPATLPVAIGIAAIVAQMTGGIPVAAAFGAAIDFALGPIGLVIAALAALGIVANLFGDNAEDATDDTGKLADSLERVAQTAQDTSFGDASIELRGYVEAAVAAAEANDLVVEGLNALGLSIEDVSRLLTGNTQQAALSIVAYREQAKAAGVYKGEVKDAIEFLDTQLQLVSLQQVAFLDSAVSQGKLTQAQRESAEAQATDTNGLINRSKAMAIAAGLIEDNERKQRALALSTGELTETYGRLREAILAGTITEADAAVVADQLHISADEAKTVINGLTQALQKFVTDGLSALPTADAAVQGFADNIGSAYSDLVSAVDKGRQDVAAARDRASKATAGLAESEQKAGDDFAETIRKAEGKVADARADAARVQGQGSESAVRAARQHLADANAGLAEAQRTAGDKQAGAIRTASATVAAAQADLATAQNKAATDNEAAKQALIKSLDPQEVIDKVFEQAVASAQFLDNLQILLEQGNARVFQVLAGQGPENAGLLAQSLVDKPEFAKKLEGALTIDQKVKQHGRDELEKAGREIVGTASDLGTTLAGGITGTFASELDFGAALTQAGKDLAASPAQKTLEQQSRFQGAQVGAAYHEGMADGMKRGQPAVADAAANLVTHADSSARTTGKIKSPSGLFIEIGEFLAEGLAVGIDNRLADVALRGSALIDAASPRGGLAAANRGPSGVLAAASVSSLAGGGDGGRGEFGEVLGEIRQLLRTRPGVEVKATLNKTDPDPHQLGHEIGWIINDVAQ